jgi:hypothetical protein
MNGLKIKKKCVLLLSGMTVCIRVNRICISLVVSTTKLRHRLVTVTTKDRTLQTKETQVALKLTYREWMCWKVRQEFTKLHFTSTAMSSHLAPTAGAWKRYLLQTKRVTRQNVQLRGHESDAHEMVTRNSVYCYSLYCKGTEIPRKCSNRLKTVGARRVT